MMCILCSVLTAKRAALVCTVSIYLEVYKCVLMTISHSKITPNVYKCLGFIINMPKEYIEISQGNMYF